jgi:hypothetical protein
MGTELICRILTRLGSMSPRVEIVDRLLDLTECCELLYRQYRRSGYCRYSPQGQHFSPFMFDGAARTFVVRHHDRIIGTISLFPDTRIGLPIDSVCKSEIDTLRTGGARLAEVGLLAIECDGRRSRRYSYARKMLVVFSLFRRMFSYAYRNGITHFAISVHPKHRPLYSFLGFKTVGECEHYAAACNAPAVSMVLDLKWAIHHGKPAVRAFFRQRPVATLGQLIPPAESARFRELHGKVGYFTQSKRTGALWPGRKAMRNSESRPAWYAAAEPSGRDAAKAAERRNQDARPQEHMRRPRIRAERAREHRL